MFDARPFGKAGLGEADLADRSRRFRRGGSRLYAHLPYLLEVDDLVVRSRENALMQSFEVTGIDGLTSGPRDISVLRDQIARLLAGLDARFTIYVHRLTRPAQFEARGIPGAGFAADLDRAWRSHLEGRGLLSFVTVVSVVRTAEPGVRVPLFRKAAARLFREETEARLANLREVVAILKSAIGRPTKDMAVSDGSLIGFYAALISGRLGPEPRGSLTLLSEDAAVSAIEVAEGRIHIAAAEVGPRRLSLPAAREGRDHFGCRLHVPDVGRCRMTETPRILLAHHLKTLKLPTFLREYDKLARQCAAEGQDHVQFLTRLVESELIDRERRMVERRIKAAKFPATKSLDSFDFKAIPQLNKMQVLELARCEWIERRENVIALGPSGTGKTHVALGLGLAACQKGLSVGFTTAATLVNELMEARDERRLLRLQKQLAMVKLLIIDELGFVPLSKTGAELLFELISQRYERGATLITSNLPFDEWTETFGSERLTGALLDRLTHHVHILEMNGDSYRLGQSRSRKAEPGT